LDNRLFPTLSQALKAYRRETMRELPPSQPRWACFFTLTQHWSGAVMSGLLMRRGWPLALMQSGLPPIPDLSACQKW